MNTTLAGIDYGTVRIGIALADASVGIASPHATWTRRGEQADAAFFRRLVKEEGIDRFVVGLPIHLDGSESQQSIEARAFGEWLEEITGVPVLFFDERFTSVEADERLAVPGMTKKKKASRRDRIAAQIMLSAFIESGALGDHSPGAID
ncbi:MAG: Holliday junction resolvase RuvX [Pirellulales bacterium]|nr:Holliday junction resolvase RuvX [Pirellulales bacterium]